MRQEQTAVMVGLVDELGQQVGLAGACQALGMPRSWY